MNVLTESSGFVSVMRKFSYMDSNSVNQTGLLPMNKMYMLDLELDSSCASHAFLVI